MENTNKPTPTPAQTPTPTPTPSEIPSAPLPQVTPSTTSIPAQTSSSGEPYLPGKYITPAEFYALRQFVKRFDDPTFKEQVDDPYKFDYYTQDEKSIALFRELFVFNNHEYFIKSQVNFRVHYDFLSLHDLFMGAYRIGSTEMNGIINHYEERQNAYLQKKVADMTLEELARLLPLLNSVSAK